MIGEVFFFLRSGQLVKQLKVAHALLLYGVGAPRNCNIRVVNCKENESGQVYLMINYLFYFIFWLFFIPTHPNKVVPTPILTAENIYWKIDLISRSKFCGSFAYNRVLTHYCGQRMTLVA